MIFFNEFIEQYYFYISIGIFIIVYTTLLVSEIVQRRNLKFEDYAISFLIIGLASVLWIIAIPILLGILIVCLYIYLVKRITKIYMKRSEE